VQAGDIDALQALAAIEAVLPEPPAAPKGEEVARA